MVSELGTPIFKHLKFARMQLYEPAGPTSAGFVVLRASGHVGSRWLAELLASQNLTFLFEFPGRCSHRRYPSMANASLDDIFGAACACRFDSAMESVCAPDDDGRIHSMGCVKDAFCGGRCPNRGTRASDLACAAVGMIDSYQPALARRIAAARRPGTTPIAIATFERDNAAKHAISKLRTSCGGTALKGNHVKAPLATSLAASQQSQRRMASSHDTLNLHSNHDNSTVPRLVSMMHIEPRLFRAEALQSLLGRRRMRDGVAKALGSPRYALHYEDLQLAAVPALRHLLAAVGVHRFDEAALARSALRKGSSEDLRRSLLNFDELNASMRHMPCMQRMLGAPTPQRFDDTCGEEAIGGMSSSRAATSPAAQTPSSIQPTQASQPVHKLAHQAKQDTAARVLRCRWSAVPARACNLVSMNRIATAAIANAAKAAGLKSPLKIALKVSTRRQRRLDALVASGGLPAGSSRPPPSAAIAALVAGECTEGERRICAEALARSDPVTHAAEEAELCVLRAADSPLPTV